MNIGYQAIVISELPSYARAAITEILNREGGYVDHADDYETKFGIRRLSADRAGYSGAIADISKDTAARIWASLFWYAPGLDRLAEVSPLIARTVMDTAGPAGVRVGITHLQEALTSYNAIVNGEKIYGDDLVCDGIIGSKTIAQLDRFVSHRLNESGERVLATRLNCLQDAHYVAVAKRLPTKRTFSFGWTKQRVLADMLALAVDTDTILA